MTAVLTLIPISALTQNLTSNPNLNSEITPWTVTLSSAPDPTGIGSTIWTSTFNDDNQMNGSGSAHVQLSTLPLPASPTPANASSGLRQCVALPDAPTAVMSVNYGAHFLIPTSGNPVVGLANATIEIRLFSDGNCLDFIPGTGGSQGLDLNGALSDTNWYEVEDSNFPMPGGAVIASSAEIRTFLRTTDATGDDYLAFFDHIFLALNGGLPVELMHFSVE